MSKFLYSVFTEIEKINPESFWQGLLLGKIDGIEVSICSDRSSVTLYKEEKRVFSSGNLDYNSSWINSVRHFLQGKSESAGVQVISQKRISQITMVARLFIRQKGRRHHFYYESSGINNKYNRLKIFRILV